MSIWPTNQRGVSGKPSVSNGVFLWVLFALVAFGILCIWLVLR